MGVKISDMSSATTPLGGSEQIECVQSGNSVKTTVDDIRGGVVFVDRIEVTGSPVASVTFGASGDGDTQAALSGDADFVYELDVYWPKADLTTRNLEIHPNGTDVGASSNWHRHVSSGTTDNGTGWAFARVGSTGSGTGTQLRARVVIWAETGYGQRMLASSLTVAAIGASAMVGSEVYGVWYDDSTNITSLKIIDESTDLPVGTKLVLYKRAG